MLCFICHGILSKNHYILPCGHRFHFICNFNTLYKDRINFFKNYNEYLFYYFDLCILISSDFSYKYNKSAAPGYTIFSMFSFSHAIFNFM